MYGINQYGTLIYSENTINSDEVQALTPDLMRYLPNYYQEVKEMIEIQSSIAKEFGLITYRIKDVYRQFFIDTATWGLTVYEKELGLQTNINLTYEERREIIKAKWRGAGTVTKQMIVNTAEAFSGGEVDVIEHPDEYYFIVKFVGVKGIPRNMQGFISMLEDIKPAHLSYEFKYTYTIWNFLNQETWNSLGTLTWNDLKVYERK